MKKQTLLIFFLLCLINFNAYTASETDKKKTICLNMIVKNESHVIARCLESVLPIIDTWVIVDTGSTDGTQQIIKDYFKKKNIPGELFERPWVNFEHNRNEALILAKHAANYVLFMDADDKLTYTENFKLPELTKDSYLIVSNSFGTKYYIPRIIKSDLNWRWIGVLHEYVSANNAKTSEILPDVEYTYIADGARSKDPEKYLKDVEVLQGALKTDPKNSRNVFYLAQSYFSAGDLPNALKYYTQRSKMGGWSEEVFWSLLQVARLQDRLEMDPKTVESSYAKAYKYRSTRVEPLYYLVNKARREENYQKGYEIAQLAMTLPQSNDMLFVEKWISDYGLLFEYSICAYWIGNYAESFRACENLLVDKNLPKIYQDFTVRNREYALEKLNLPAIHHQIAELILEPAAATVK